MTAERTKEMLDTLKADFYAIWRDGKSGSLSNINLDVYKNRFGVTDTDIETYCATLKRVVPVHPCCMICGAPWRGPNDKIRPVNNGHYIECVDGFTAYCPSDAHDALWYFQEADGRCSFDMEVDIDETHYDVRWNCACMVKECFSKNVVYKRDEDGAGEIVAYFYKPVLPVAFTREQLYELIKAKV